MRRTGGICSGNSHMNVTVLCESLYVKYREKDFQKCLHDSRTFQKQNERVNPPLNS